MAPAPQRGPAQPGAALTAAMAGAVDLAAVKARSDAAARAAEAPAPTAGHYAVDVTEASFQTEVLDRSFQVPVLLSAWSARSPASGQLNDTLAQIVTERAGALVRAKVEVDANMSIAQALQLRGVPAVFAVIAGQLVPGFEGALPEAQLREFVAAVLQAGSEAGLTAAAPPSDADAGHDLAPPAPDDPRFDAAEAALADGDFALAAERFQAILDAEPGNADAAAALRQVRLLDRVTRLDPATAAEAAPDDVTGQLAAADVELAGDDADAALRRLLELLVRVTGEQRDAVRERLIEYFDLLGPDDPRVPPARRQMARALF
jgi:putative thioredoxin